MLAPIELKIKRSIQSPYLASPVKEIRYLLNLKPAQLPHWVSAAFGQIDKARTR